MNINDVDLGTPCGFRQMGFLPVASPSIYRKPEPNAGRLLAAGARWIPQRPSPPATAILRQLHPRRFCQCLMRLDKAFALHPATESECGRLQMLSNYYKNQDELGRDRGGLPSVLRYFHICFAGEHAPTLNCPMFYRCPVRHWFGLFHDCWAENTQNKPCPDISVCAASQTNVNTIR